MSPLRRIRRSNRSMNSTPQHRHHSGADGDSDTALSRYIANIKEIPELSREEEMLLARRWTVRGEREAATELVNANLRYVIAIALTYRRYGLSLSELIAEGNFGIVHAIRKFDPERGTRFVTYAAYWI